MFSYIYSSIVQKLNLKRRKTIVWDLVWDSFGGTTTNMAERNTTGSPSSIYENLNFLSTSVLSPFGRVRNLSLRLGHLAFLQRFV